MDKKAVFKEITDKFETESMKYYCEDMIEKIPDYIFTMPSSTSRKYHNFTQCLTHGQIYHIVMFGKIVNYRLDLKANKEKFNNAIERDAMRCVSIFHDAIKCGWNGSAYTVHEHPILAGEWVRTTKVEHDVDDEIKDMIARMCERHSGEWTTNKRSKVILPEPETEMEIFIHECDILSSRSDIDLPPSDYLKGILGEKSYEKPTIDTYVFNFGKHNGKSFKTVMEEDPSYLTYLKSANYSKEPLRTFLSQIDV